ncbi:hypothetical protein QR77_20390 [Streptomyces sp. 150FB]|nr:hypothetical protein QR77_20390 [Streptomyces sp. 150FB]
MSGHTGTGAGTGAHTGRSTSWSMGGALFAGVVMVISGATDILQGVVALKNDAFLNGVTGYAYTFNVSSWGYVHVILGGLIALAGIGILMKSQIARFVGIALAAINLVGQFMYLPHQPVWAVVGMALSAFAIWALTTQNRMARA